MNDLRPSRGSHLAVLIKLVNETTGPILEMGSGVCSTYFLHWACFPTNRKLVTCENKPEYYDFARRFGYNFHTVHCTEDLDSLDLSGPWSIAFIDHEPPERRGVEVERLKDCADYIVVHDTDAKRMAAYGFNADLLNGLFKYKWRYKRGTPYTSVFSNRCDLSGLHIQ
jgi:hypothetical protein